MAIALSKSHLSQNISLLVYVMPRHMEGDKPMPVPIITQFSNANVMHTGMAN